jgi:hypothetical protein
MAAREERIYSSRGKKGGNVKKRGGDYQRLEYFWS